MNAGQSRKTEDRTDWSEGRVAQLRALWAQQEPRLSTAEIGRRMGLSKNAVVSKADRIGLQGRPSPIRRRGGDDVAAEPAKTPWQLAREEAGRYPLDAFHPIAMAVLAEARSIEL